MPHVSKRSRDEDNDSTDKRRRVIGPAPPPPASSFTPASPPADDSSNNKDDSSDSDDDFGPAPPPAGGQNNNTTTTPTPSAFDTDPAFAHQPPSKAQRDEWMTLPPTQDDLAARMDPTKLRARKFNSAKTAPASTAMSSAWTETPQQKLKRLQDEALGISAPPNAPTAHPESRQTKEDERRTRKMREKIEAARGKSLVEQHTEKGTGKDKEDDPSKRAFDYEKDMAVSGTVNHKQRREMLAKSKGFSDRFSRGNFL